MPRVREDRKQHMCASLQKRAGPLGTKTLATTPPVARKLHSSLSWRSMLHLRSIALFSLWCDSPHVSSNNEPPLITKTGLNCQQTPICSPIRKTAGRQLQPHPDPRGSLAVASEAGQAETGRKLPELSSKNWEILERLWTMRGSCHPSSPDYCFSGFLLLKCPKW